MSFKDKIPPSLKKAIDLLSVIPSYGERSAGRFIYSLLKLKKEERIKIAEAIMEAVKNLRNCKECFIVTDKEVCDICADSERNKRFICVVEESQDAYTIEKLGRYTGVYHVLLGRIAPLEGISPQDLTIDKLLERIEKYGVKEVILATNPNVEGEATANYIGGLILKRFPAVKVTRTSYGLQFGSLIELSDEISLEKSMENRRELK